MASVRVAVRVCPLDEREKLSSNVVTEVKANSITIYKPIGSSNRGEEPKTFSFDFSYDSTDPQSSSFGSQERIYNDLGSDVIKAAFEGFNSCIFAYGQSRSGKSYTMMGREGAEGLIPRILEGLFEQIAEKSKSAVSFYTEVSFMEIYNERVQDLLQNDTTSPDKNRLKVREHPKEGPYVQNLTRHLVQTYSDAEELISLGNAKRTTASTDTIDTSSRSHTIFTIRFTQAWFEDALPCETVSKIHLVDLAGSERADATRATGARLKEGGNINKSLVTLGCVISTLVLFQNIATTKKKKQIFIPYRDSVLTWLLKDSLGGNSKTTMIATVSPAEGNYGETLSTLHYASRAKTIVNSPKVNEDGSVKVIRGLQAEIQRLRRLLEEANQVPKGEQSSCAEVVEKLHENEAKVAALTKEWTSKWNESHCVLKEDTVVLRKRRSGVVLDCQLPHLIGIDQDLLGCGIILYYLKEGQTSVGCSQALCGLDIVLQGPGLLDEHCALQNQDGIVTLIPHDGALCLVNGSVITAPCQITQGSIIQLGEGAMFRFNHPTEAALLREKQQSGQLSAVSLSLTDMSKSAVCLSKVMLQRSGVDHRGMWDEGELGKRSQDTEGFVSENSGDLLDSTAEHRQEAEAEETCTELVNMVCVKTSKPTEALAVEATPVKSAVPHPLDGEAHQGGVHTRDSPKQEGDRCYKSGPELMSEAPRKRVQSGAGEAGCGGEVWSGDASFQQTSVPGRSDGCGAGPVGSANEIQEVTADCNEERPDSGGNSLSGSSHLQSVEGSESGSIEQQACAHSQFGKTALSSQAGRPVEESAAPDPSSCREMDEVRGWEGVLEVRAKPSPGFGLGSLVSTVSWIVQGTGRRILNSSVMLQSLCPACKILSVVRGSRVMSMVKNSYISSLVSEINIFSFVKDLPFVQHMHLEMTQHFQAIIPTMTQENIKNQVNPVSSTPKPDADNMRVVGQNGLIQSDDRKLEKSLQTRSNLNSDQANDLTSVLCCKEAGIFCHSLITFPESMLKLQSSPSDLGVALQSVLPPLFNSQRVVALFWLKAAKRNNAKAVPALVIVMESSVLAVTENCGSLEVFHHLPLAQLRALHIGFAGHSLCLLGPTEESVLGLYTYSQSLCRELCGAVLGILCPADSRVCEHPLLRGDLLELSLKWQALVPSLQLDAGLRVCSSFQKSLADLYYLLHCSTIPGQSCPAEMCLLLYCCVRICFPSSMNLIGQLFVTDTHMGLVLEDVVFPPVRSVSSELSRLQFHSLSVRQLADVRGVVVREEDSRGAVTVDVILANMKGRGHPGCAHPSSHAEVWKLTFSCCAEAARLINHLSNV